MAGTQIAVDAIADPSNASPRLYGPLILYEVNRFTAESTVNWDLAREFIPSLYLVRLWAGQSVDRATRVCIRDQLQQVRSRRGWLACSCMGKVASPPLMTVALTDTGTHYVKRLTGRSQHADGCVFAFESRETLPDVGEERPRAYRRAPDFVAIRRGGLVSTPERRAHTRGGHGGTHGDAIQTRLFHVLMRAGMHRTLAPGQFPHNMIRAAAGSIVFRRRLMLSSVLYLGPTPYRENFFPGAFKACEEIKLAPQCWWIDVVDAIDQDKHHLTLHAMQKPIQVTVAGELSVFSGEDSPARGPWLMMALVGPDDNGVPEVKRAYAHPVFSRSLWIPVDSNKERDALEKIIDSVSYVSRTYQQNIEFEKPLAGLDGFSMEVRPDFILSLGDRKLLIETMGSDDPEYREQKKRTHAEMANVGEVFQDERAGDDKAADQALNKRIIRWAVSK